ncbi:unnamed protein product [Lactuca virosa]|uniref:Uncharacterized protein n=1 Tax=Lactuca virosa TaxID=75947 RepID=A0AAU9MWZ3_9ASTR|nr:unnamed protein product [Lactuca virosa]
MTTKVLCCASQSKNMATKRSEGMGRKVRGRIWILPPETMVTLLKQNFMRNQHLRRWSFQTLFPISAAVSDRSLLLRNNDNEIEEES